MWFSLDTVEAKHADKKTNEKRKCEKSFDEAQMVTMVNNWDADTLRKLLKEGVHPRKTLFNGKSIYGQALCMKSKLFPPKVQ